MRLYPSPYWSARTQLLVRRGILAFECLVTAAFMWTATSAVLLPYIWGAADAGGEGLNKAFGGLALMSCAVVVLFELWLVRSIHHLNSQPRSWLVVRAMLFTLFLSSYFVEATPLMWAIAALLLLESAFYIQLWRLSRHMQQSPRLGVTPSVPR